MLSEELDVDRDFTFQNGAVEFLLRNNFNFGNCFSNGVRYLSRSEEAEALALAEMKALKTSFEDIVLTQHDVEALGVHGASATGHTGVVEVGKAQQGCLFD